MYLAESIGQIERIVYVLFNGRTESNRLSIKVYYISIKVIAYVGRCIDLKIVIYIDIVIDLYMYTYKVS